MSTLLCLIAKGGDFCYSFVKWGVISKLSPGQPGPGVGVCGKFSKFSQCARARVCVCGEGGGGSLLNAVGCESFEKMQLDPYN